MRFVIVDDTDLRIQYNGPWFADVGSQDSVGYLGPPFRSTLHGTQVSASLEFAYNGTGVFVYGTNNVQNVSGVISPTWECFIDGTLIAPPSNPFVSEITNNWILCVQDAVLDGPHILTVNATVKMGQTFWFDEIRYVPSASVPLDQETILVDWDDPQLQYGKGWDGGMTNTTGSTFTFDFIGVSISGYGTTPWQGTPSLAAYSVDGKTPTDFVLKGTPSTNQKLFETAQLPPGPHTLKVLYEGNINSTLLQLNYLVVQNATLPSTAPSASSLATSTSTASISTPGRKSSTPVGALVGGVIGGLTVIILGLLLLRRHKRRAAEKMVFSSTPRPFDFEYTSLHPSSTIPNYSLPLQQSTLTIGRPWLPPPLPVSRPWLLPLLSKAERNAELLAASGSQRRGDTLPAMVSMQSNATGSPDVVIHEDSGGRMQPSTPAMNEIMEVPPLYTVE